MTIDPQTLADRIEAGELSFFCANDQERIALFTALDDLGYRWNSDHGLFEWYGVSHLPGSVTFSICDKNDKRIVIGSKLIDCKTPVADLATQKQPAIDPSALLTMLGA